MAYFAQFCKDNLTEISVLLQVFISVIILIMCKISIQSQWNYESSIKSFLGYRSKKLERNQNFFFFLPIFAVVICSSTACDLIMPQEERVPTNDLDNLVWLYRSLTLVQLRTQANVNFLWVTLAVVELIAFNVV